MSRIYGKAINIDIEKIKENYDLVFKNVRKGHWDDEGQKKRIEIEGKLISSLIKKYHIETSVICDFACGDGFPAVLFKNDSQNKHYIGYDFSKSAIEVCQKIFHDLPKYVFFEKNLFELNVSDFDSSKMPSLILSMGLFLYFNDDELRSFLFKVSQLRNVHFYFRQTSSIINERITLDGLYSEELELYYSAIYRTNEEYLEMFKECAFEVLETGIIEGMKQKEETSLRFYLLKTE